MLSINQFSDTTPYPPITVCAENSSYAAAMLSNIGSCNSEMSAISLYFYNSIITEEHFPDIAECFHKISIVEMHHLDIFGKLTLLLGSDPRLWYPERNRPVYWSPSCNHYPRYLKELLLNSLRGEQEAIKKYQKQAVWIKDPHIVAILKRIILDEQLHIQIFRELYDTYVTNNCIEK